MNEKRPERRSSAIEAYLKESFLTSSDARPLRLLAEYLEPRSRFDRYKIDDTIVFMGSARLSSREQAEAEVHAAGHGEGNLERARERLAMSRYYEDAQRARVAALDKAFVVIGFGLSMRLLTQVPPRKGREYGPAW